MRRLLWFACALGLVVVAASQAQDVTPRLGLAQWHLSGAEVSVADSHGPKAQVGEALAAFEGFSGEASSGDPESEHDVDVRPSAGVLRLAAHGTEETNSDPAPHVLLGRGPPRV